VASSPRPLPTILHADLDAFYASVEQLLDPSLKGLPIAVGGGVVLAASYEAKAFGVDGGMSGWRAKQLCPTLRFVGGHFSEYQRLADEVMAVLRDVTPSVERISIDEAFLDVAGAIRLFGPPDRIATRIRSRVRDEIGLPISIGAATTKHLAKVASQVAKPDGLVVVEPGLEGQFLHPLPVGLLWGVGPKTRERLASVGIHTVGDLAATDPDNLERILGRAIGSKLGALANNADTRRVEGRRRARSVGAQSALGRREATPLLLRSAFGHLAERVGARLRKGNRAGRTITIRLRFADMRSITRSVTLPVPTSATSTIAEVAVDLASQALAEHPEEREITLVAVSVSGVVDEAAIQLELPFGKGLTQAPTSAGAGARATVERALDRVRDKFGRSSIAYAGVTFGDARGAPDAFRELAEDPAQEDLRPW
jgi:DNA polymerase IV